MKRILFLFCGVAFFALAIVQGQPKRYSIHTLAFYNLENLFDTVDDLDTNDDEWTPAGAQHWTTEKYEQKLKNLSRVLSEIGKPDNPNAPTIIGGAEIENRTVLEDLIHQPKLLPYDYGIIHFDSPDRRGIDVALLYQKKYFKPVTYSNIPLRIYRKKAIVKQKEKELPDDESEGVKEDKGRIFTRDQLLVSGFLEGEEIHIIVNHWPSRFGGEKASSPFREAAGRLNRTIIDSLQKINPNAKVITMGDLNDGPHDKSVKIALGAKAIKSDVQEFGVFNPFAAMADEGKGTIAYRDSWSLFDQILMTETFLKADFLSFKYWKSGIFNKPFLVQTSGQYKGYPLRHSLTEVGFSDHFPVYIYLIREFK